LKTSVLTKPSLAKRDNFKLALGLEICYFAKYG
jgi:hypothetical protein